MIDTIDYQHTGRRELFQLRAKNAIVKKRIAEKQQRINAVDAQKDDAVDTYARMTTPIQNGLREIEEAEVAANIEGKQLDPAIEQRRKNLQQQLEDENTNLERAKTEVENQLRPLRAELATLMTELPNLEVVEAQLFRTGDKEKRERHEGWLLAIQTINGGCTLLQKNLADCDHRIRAAEGASDPRLAELNKNRRAKWAHAVSELGRVRAEFNERATKLRHEIINE